MVATGPAVSGNWKIVVMALQCVVPSGTLSSCASTNDVLEGAPEPRVIMFGQEDPLADFDARMAEARYPIDIDGVTIENCADVFAAMGTNVDLQWASEFRQFVDYNECFELPMLCHARVAEQNLWRVEGLAEEIYQRLDLGSIGSSFGPRRPADSYRYADFELPHPKFSAVGFEIETEGWYYALWLRAVADFDGDGVADVLVTFVDHTKRATYFDVSPVILSRDTLDEGIRGRRVIRSVLNGTWNSWPDDPMTCDRAN